MLTWNQITQKKGYLIGMALLSLISCHSIQEEDSLKKVKAWTEQGAFSQAETFIDSLKQYTGKSDPQIPKLDSVLDVIHRIRIDFSWNETKVKQRLARYYPNLDDSLFQQWEESGKIEMRLIDGEKCYFKNAVSNLFRIDTLAAQTKVKLDGEMEDVLGAFRVKHTSEIIQNSNTSSTPAEAKEMVLHYTVKLKANAVPDGEIVRCWMPFPKEGNARQKHIQLLSSDPDSVLISSKDYAHRSAYMEKLARKDEVTEFKISFSVESSGQYFDIQAEDVKPYNLNSEDYQKYTAERFPQIVFTKQIQQLGLKIVGDEVNPFLQAKKIYKWINDSITWAGALEYSIMPQIPTYVLDTRHGDCGMQTLLFMSLARSQGIPVKWQSGWMLHPMEINLHDWCEVYYESIGWVPLDQSFNLQKSNDKKIREFYIHGIDSYRLIVNDDYGQDLFPAKKFARSEPYDFQRGEMEWREGNLYFDKWTWHMDVEYK